MTVKLVLLLSSFLASCLSVQSSEVTVSPDCSNVTTLPCIELDGAFLNLSSNTELLLEPGEHVLHMYHGQHLVGLHDVSIMGVEGEEPVRITCDEEIGMTFIDMHHLVISNIIVDGCGLSNSSLRDATNIVKGFLDLIFVIPESVRIGVFLAQCTDLSISDSEITNTVGLGLLGVNILGDSSLQNVSFIRNIRMRCEREVRTFPFNLEHDALAIGGGAYILYQDSLMSNASIQDSTLRISQCHFFRNAECTYTSNINVNYKYYFGSYDLKYYIGGGGGLSIFMPQVTFAVVVKVSNSDFRSNDARYGAGAHIGFFSQSVSDVWFSSCTFNSNGYPSQQGFQVANGGAGVAVFTDLLQRSYEANHSPLRCDDDCNNIYFNNTNFTNNYAAVEGGGVYVYSLSTNQVLQRMPLDFYSNINFTKCVFHGNTAKYGAGMYISQRAMHGTEGTWGVNLTDVTVLLSIPPHTIGSSIRGHYSAVSFESVFVTLTKGSLIIRFNMASGLHLYSSILYLMDDTSVILQDNHARRGGGAYMDGSYPVIIASRNSSVIFRSNVASDQGGGVFFESKPAEKGILRPLNTADCFLSSTAEHSGDYGHGMFDSNITVEFKDNQAPIGSVIFGSTLNSCSWAKAFNVSDKDLYLELYKQNSTFKFNEIPTGTNAVSTLPYFITVSPDDKNVSSCPGKARKIDVSVQDVFMNDIESVLASAITDDCNCRHSVKLGSSGSWYVRTDAHLPIPLNVEGESGDNITVSLYTASNLVSTDITVNILPCLIGFVYDNETERCSCDPRIVKLKTPSICDEERVQLTVPPLVWLGCTSECSSTDDLVLLDCYFGFCNTHNQVFDASNPSLLCAAGSHRNGIMCGKCADGYSNVFGSDVCSNCTDVSPAIVISINLISGIITFLFISLLGITIDKGWTYMVIFFSNVIFPYSFYESVFLKYMFIPTNAFAQGSFIRSCFYDGLDSLGKIGFGFVYCAYLYILMVLFTIWCRCSLFASKYFFPPKTLVALIFLTYNVIFKYCAKVLSAMTVSNVAGTEKSVRWLVDPNIVYFHNWHAVLGTLSIILVLVHVIPFPILLLSPSLAYKHGQYFKPFLDAIWAPFKPKYRIWASLRLAVPAIVLMFSTFMGSLTGITANMILLAIFLYAQSILQPFKDKLINVADNFLILLALFVHFGEFQKFKLHFEFTNISFKEVFFVVFPMCLAYLVLTLTFLWYSRNSIQKFCSCFYAKLCSRCCKRQRDQYLSIDSKMQPSIQNRPTHSSVSIMSKPRHRNFTRMRESLLEGDESLHFVVN